MESIAADNKKAVEQRIKAAEELQKAFDKLLSDFDAKSKEETQNYYNDLAKRRAKDLQETETYFSDLDQIFEALKPFLQHKTK